MYEYGNLIAGQWQQGEGNKIFTYNPARPDEVVGSYTAASVQQVNEAVQAALVAQKKWRQLPSIERGAIIEKFIVAIEARGEELARAISLEQGKPLPESRGEIAKACAESRFMVGEASRSQGQTMPSSRQGFSNKVFRRPRGVIAALTPWNFPIMTPMRKIAPALAFGNAVILKPSEFTPAAACIVGSAAQGILPDGLLQIVIGLADVGQALVSHPDLNGIAFTGSVPVGQKIYMAAAQNLTEVALELGGKNAVVIHDTDDMESCLDQIIASAFPCAGQRCTGISRVIVHASLESQVLDGLVRRAQQVVLGDGMLEGVTMGALNNAMQLKKVSSMVQAGVIQGAKVLTGGQEKSIEGAKGGFFYEPTILAHVLPNMSVATDEIFGPVLSVLSYKTLEQAFEILNSVEFGLTSALFSNNHAVIQRFIAESESGMIHVNHGTIPENHMPFGGIKKSGVGAYSVGSSAANFFTTEHSVYEKSV